MRRKLSLLLFTLIVSLVQVYGLPPSFGPEYEGKTQRDELTRTFIPPQRIVWKYAGEKGDLVQNEQVLLQAGNSQAIMGRTGMCRLMSSGNDTASIILDYGKELHGGLQLVMGSSSRREPSLVRIRFGESVGEANCTALNSEWKVGFGTDDHAMRDFIIEIPRDGSIEIGNTGFRFVRIDLLQKETTISIKEARATLRCRDIQYLGSFKSSSERLNKIWMTAAYTVHLTMQEFLWDGIKRDRLVWMGDMHPEIATIMRVFGYNEVVPESLDFACRQFPLPRWMNNISAYSMWYLIIQYEWYLQNGNIDFLKKHRDYILGLVALIDSKIDEQGNEDHSPRLFLDWPSSPNQAGVEAGYRGLLSWALKDAAILCKLLDSPGSATMCDAARDRLSRKFLPPNNLKQAAALMSLGGIMEPRKATDEVLAVGGAKGFSTFYGYYMLQALALSGDYDLALDIIDKYWGGMLDMGATTFWEDFNIEWMENASRIDELTPKGKKDIHGDFGAYCYPGYRHSLCHGWSSGPAAWLSEHVLGVKVMEPGCKVIKIEPHLGNLTWVEGTYPTPMGVIRIKHIKLADGSIKTTVKAPKGIKIIKNRNNKLKTKAMNIYDFTVENSKGVAVNLSDYKGKTLLIVNVASKCGFTKQYKPLEALYEKYKDQGFIILGFPCNQFAGQEPGTNDEIQSFCQLNYGVTFPVFGKIKVNGKEAAPLYNYLKEQTGGKSIKWNFNKFLIDKNGNIIKRYLSGDSLEGLEADINAIL
jgi:alpha-L-rhamnosidase